MEFNFGLGLGVPEVAGAAMPMAALAGVAIATALAAGVLVTAGFHVSGGHLNPAVTVALLARGHITAFRSALYVAAQLLASSLACILLRYLTGGMVSTQPVTAVNSFFLSLPVKIRIREKRRKFFLFGGGIMSFSRFVRGHQLLNLFLLAFFGTR
jgi:glycerol uptake facilitator-like aquaporin